MEAAVTEATFEHCRVFHRTPWTNWGLVAGHQLDSMADEVVTDTAEPTDGWVDVRMTDPELGD